MTGSCRAHATLFPALRFRLVPMVTRLDSIGGSTSTGSRHAAAEGMSAIKTIILNIIGSLRSRGIPRIPVASGAGPVARGIGLEAGKMPAGSWSRPRLEAGATRSRRSLRGRCPEHADAADGLHVDDAPGLYHCFACGRGGDVVRWTMARLRLSEGAAVDHLARRAGLLPDGPQ